MQCNSAGKAVNTARQMEYSGVVKQMKISQALPIRS